MSEFSGYEKMPSSIKKMGLNESDFAKLEKVSWVVTEKIHGANFSFVYENAQLKFAKRKAYLSWSDDFFGFQLVASKLENQVLQLFEQLSADILAEKYILYGELFGGAYPHPKVPVNPDLQAIQTGVYYAPDIHFCAFDIAFTSNEDTSKTYLDYEKAIPYFRENQILYAKPLWMGKFGEALNFNTRINSTIPQELDLPSLQENLIEGVVIKPFQEIAPDQIKTRPIFKVKNKEFEEEKKFHEAQKWSFIPQVSTQSQELDFILEEIRNYLNHNRLESATSKIGQLDFENDQRIEEVKDELLNDILTDFNESNDQLLEEISAEQKNWISQRLQSDINKFLNTIKNQNDE